MWSSVARWPKNASKNGESSKQTKICKDFYRFLFWHGRCTCIRSQIRTYLEIQAQVKGLCRKLCSHVCGSHEKRFHNISETRNLSTDSGRNNFHRPYKVRFSCQVKSFGRILHPEAPGWSSLSPRQAGNTNSTMRAMTPWLMGWRIMSWHAETEMSVSRKIWLKDKRYDKWCVFEKIHSQNSHVLLIIYKISIDTL